ncbi:MAG: hypothetical protein II695_05045 [Oscillospiraceae bacterium]|nr:hypothetical protein [Oscillospiraceae bacterium]
MSIVLRYLTPTDCAECRQCCVFDRYGLWDTPVITEENAQAIRAMRDDIHFIGRPDAGYIFNMGQYESGDMCRCPALGAHGCTLDENKPFDCQIWPYMAVRHEGKIYAAVSELCPVYSRIPIDALRDEADALHDILCAAVSAQPGIVRDSEGCILVKELY